MDHKKRTSVHRRDGSGHLDAAYAAKLRELGGDTARIKEPEGFVHESHSSDPLAEELGESFVRAVTSGEDAEVESLDAVVVEEEGGPFVTTNAKDEFASGTDESNPEDAFREPFPTV